MKIIRDGIEIELTERELREAYNEQDLAYYAMDLVEHAGLWEQELSVEDALGIAEAARENVNDNDGYFEHYWESIDLTLNENGIFDPELQGHENTIS